MRAQFPRTLKIPTFLELSWLERLGVSPGLAALGYVLEGQRGRYGRLHEIALHTLLVQIPPLFLLNR